MTPTQTITQYHPLLHSIALRILRCQADAEDVVQDTFLKWLTLDTSAIQNPKAYLVRAVTHNCLNHLQSLQRRKEEYLENLQLPEFLLRVREADFSHLDLEAELQAALTVIYTRLEPLERAVYLLRDVFNMDYESLQAIFEKEATHCRQLFSRARKKLREVERPSLPTRLECPAFLESFRRACDFGSVSELIQDLKKEVAA